MSHHYRSCSEQLHPTIQINNNNNTNNNQTQELPRQDSFVRVYSDSQSSLDRLFDLPNIQATVPLRNRNLPASFFNPTWQQQQANNNHNNNNHHHRVIQPQHLHTRSVSLFHQRPPPIQEVTNGTTTNNTTSNTNGSLRPSEGPFSAAPAMLTAQARQQHQHQNIHMRSRSSIAPMTSGVDQPANQLARDNLEQHHQQQQPPPTFNNANNGTYFPGPAALQTTLSVPAAIDDVASSMHHCNMHQPVSPTYFNPDLYIPLESESMQQNFQITHSQPYVPYDPSLSTSFSSLNPSSSLTATSSSSSSNENNSIIGVPNSIDAPLPSNGTTSIDRKQWVQGQEAPNVYFNTYH